jgi:hypothetical protein
MLTLLSLLLLFLVASSLSRATRSLKKARSVSKGLNLTFTSTGRRNDDFIALDTVNQHVPVRTLETISTALSVRRGKFTGPNPLPKYEYRVDDREEEILTHSRTYHIFNTKKKYFACLIPKAGCSSWLDYIRKGEQLPAQKIFYAEINYPEQNFFYRKNKIEDLNTVVKIINDQEYFKFVIVRHPWNRLVSAYRSKFEGQCQYDHECMKEKFGVPIDMNDPEPLTFHKFVQLLMLVPSAQLDKHFRPMHYLCELNHIPYDYVADLELPEDMNFISDKLGFQVSFAGVRSLLSNCDKHSRSLNMYI